ncbi:MAG TPA: hypothetical protein PLP75_04365 [Burkholderiales bacterium]|nr:hypothetical protein [Burkholderiales bacterium]
MKKLISQTQFAALVKANQGTISKYVKNGKLPAQGNKLIMPDAEAAYYLLLGGATTQQAAENAEKTIGVNASFAQAKAVYQTYLAKIKKLDFEQMQGNLISVDDVIKEVETVATVMRTELFSIPAKVAPECEGKSISQIELIIHNAINEAFCLLNDFDYYQFNPAGESLG